MKMNNGDVFPSFLSVGSTPNFDTGSYFNNSTFTKGEVVKAIYPDDDASQSKKFMEYNVYIEKFQNNTNNGELLQNIPFWNPLASGVDHETVVLREADEDPWSKNNPISNGSKVLVMFIHGQSTQGVILGGIRNINEDQDTGDLPKENGLYWYRVFNGFAQLVDDKGAFSLNFTGPLKNDGKRDTDKVPDDAVGSNFQMKSDGSLYLATKNNNQFINVDHNKKVINQQADSGYNVKVSNGKITTKSNGVEFGSATDKMMMGSTYRQAEQQLHSQMLSIIQSLQTSFGILAAQLSTAAAGAAPSGAGPGLTGASAAALTCVSELSQLSTAIQSFESQATSYLSDKNLLDK